MRDDSALPLDQHPGPNILVEHPMIFTERLPCAHRRRHATQTGGLVDLTAIDGVVCSDRWARLGRGSSWILGCLDKLSFSLELYRPFERELMPIHFVKDDERETKLTLLQHFFRVAKLRRRRRRPMMQRCLACDGDWKETDPR